MDWNEVVVMDLLIAVISGSVGAGVMSIIQAWLQRKWSKKDKRDERIDSLVEAQKVMMIDRVKHVAKDYISDGEISLDDKNNLMEMYKAYKGLGGNGHLDLTMREVEKLTVIS